MDGVNLLTISRNLSGVNGSNRKLSSKYQCVASSSEFLCLGASSGSTYVYDRINGKLLKLFSHNVNAINVLRFSPNEKFIAAADSRGSILCWEVDDAKKDFKLYKELTDFQGTKITAICWNQASTRLFAGNNNGLAMAFNITGMVFHGSETIHKSGDPIVQMDCCQERLVISSTSKAMVCFLERSQFHQIGTKSRDGQFGACFLNVNKETPPIIYSARPGSRLWEVDFDGQVIATHQFKEAFSVAPSSIVAHRDISLPPVNEKWNQPQSFNFPQLIPFLECYILTWSPRGIYLMNPVFGAILLWNDQIKDISSISCIKNVIYILHVNGTVTEITCHSLKHCLLELSKWNDWTQLAHVACHHEEEILKNVEHFISIGFDEVITKIMADEDKVVDGNDHLIQRLKHLIAEVDERHAEIRQLVQEKINETIDSNTELVNSSDPVNMDDSDLEIRSTASEGMSETSSKLSISRLSDMKDSIVQKATNVVVSKVFKSGFMKKAFREALESDSITLDALKRPANKPVQNSSHSTPSQSLPTSPRLKRSLPGLLRHASEQSLFHADNSITSGSSDVEDIVGKNEMSLSADTNLTASKSEEVISKTSKEATSAGGKEEIMSSSHKDISSSASKDDELVFRRGRKRSTTRKKKKAKVIELDDGNERPIQESVQKPERVEEEKTVPIDPFIEQDSRENVKKTGNEIAETISAASHSMLTLPDDSTAIINKLVNTTFSVRNDLRDAAVMYNPASFLDKLKRWAACLSEVTTEFREECFRSLDPVIQSGMNSKILSYLDVECNSLFFKHCHSAFSDVCNLAMLCVESNTFPARCNSLKSHELNLLTNKSTMQDLIKDALGYIEQLKNENDASKTSVESSLTEGKLILTDVEEGDNTDFSISPSETSENNQHNQQSTVLETPQESKKILLEDLMGSADIKDLLFDKKHNFTPISNSDLEPPQSFDISDDVSFSSDMSSIADNPAFCENFTSSFGSSKDCAYCALDRCRACFVLRYFPVVNFGRIRTLLSWSSKCRWRTWLACLVRLKYLHCCSDLLKKINNPNTTDMELVEEVQKIDVKIVLALSSELYTRSTTLFFKCMSSKNLTPWEITCLVYTGFLGNYTNKKSGGSELESFLYYAHEIVTSFGEKKLDPLFVHFAMTSAFQQQQRDQYITQEQQHLQQLKQPQQQGDEDPKVLDKAILFCGCGKPMPGSNRINWKHDLLLRKLVSSLSRHYGAPRDAHKLHYFTNLCRTSGYWYGYIRLAQKNEENMVDIIRLLAHLQDYDLLVELIDQNQLVFSDDHWSTLLHEVVYIKKRDHQCTVAEGWKSTLTFDRLIYLIAINSGPQFAFTCLKIVPDMSNFQEVHMNILRALELESKEKLIISKLIEVASEKVWSKPNNCIPYKFRMMKDAELKGEDLISPSLQPNDYLQDEADMMWGRNINISGGDCPVCTLPLCLKSQLSASAGLIIFQCGHSFHQTCVPENACLVCYHDNFSTML